MTQSKSAQRIESAKRIVLEHLCIAGSLALPLLVPSIEAQAQSTSPRAFRQTSDPYFHSPAVERQAAPATREAATTTAMDTWSPPITNKTTHRDQALARIIANATASPTKTSNVRTEVWKSLAPKTEKPIQRIDFSKLKSVSPATVAATSGTAAQNFSPLKPQSNLVPLAAVTQVATVLPQNSNDAGSIIRQQAIPQAATDLNFAVKTKADHEINHAIRQQLSPLLPAVSRKVSTANLTAKPMHSTTQAMSQKSGTSDFQPSATFNNTPLMGKSKIVDRVNEVAPFSSDFSPGSRVVTADAPHAPSEVSQATYAQPGDGDFQPGAKLKQLGKKFKSIAGAASQASENASGREEYRIADAATSMPIYDGIYQENPVAAVVGESFEPSRVVALVGGQPIFVGDMIFEINQLLEKYMQGAPEAAKKQQRASLVKRLLPKYVDQKMLFIATTRQLPEGADIEDIITQAEKTFREKVMVDLMKKSNIETTALFDAHLRAQGSSLRQMRRVWAMDQVSRYFLSEQVKVDEDITHLDMLNEYRTNFATYKKNAKCRWEQIEIEFDRAGGRFAAKDQIQEIYDRIVHGGNFEAIARKESHGFRASAGGQHDWTNRDSLVNKKIDNAIFTLPQGRLSELIESNTSWHIVRVVERIDEHHTSFEEAQAEIKKEILDKKRDLAFKAYLTDLREQIPVEYYEQ